MYYISGCVVWFVVYVPELKRMCDIVLKDYKVEILASLAKYSISTKICPIFILYNRVDSITRTYVWVREDINKISMINLGLITN